MDAPEFTYPFSPGHTLRLCPDSSLLATQYMTLTILPYYLCFYFCRTIRFLWSTFHVFICRLEFLFCKLSAAAAANSHQSCPTLCNPIDGSPPGSPIPGILQARTLEWVAISFSSRWKWKVKVKSLSRVWLLATPWTAAYQAPPSMAFSRQEYWSRVPLPSPRDYPNILF